MPTAHATLPPSGSARWMKCHPSAVVAAQFPQKDTIFTREGTIAHAMAECLLLTALEQNWDEWREDYVDKFRVAYVFATAEEGKYGTIAGEQSEALRLRIQEAFRGAFSFPSPAPYAPSSRSRPRAAFSSLCQSAILRDSRFGLPCSSA